MQDEDALCRGLECAGPRHAKWSSSDKQHSSISKSADILACSYSIVCAFVARPLRGSKKWNPPNDAPLIHWGALGIIKGFHSWDSLGGRGVWTLLPPLVCLAFPASSRPAIPAANPKTLAPATALNPGPTKSQMGCSQNYGSLTFRGISMDPNFGNYPNPNIPANNSAPSPQPSSPPKRRSVRVAAFWTWPAGRAIFPGPSARGSRGYRSFRKLGPPFWSRYREDHRIWWSIFAAPNSWTHIQGLGK